MKIWERRLLRDFHVTSVAGEGDNTPTDNGDERFRKLAILISKVNAEENDSDPQAPKRNIKMM